MSLTSYSRNTIGFHIQFSVLTSLEHQKRRMEYSHGIHEVKWFCGIKYEMHARSPDLKQMLLPIEHKRMDEVNRSQGLCS